MTSTPARTSTSPTRTTATPTRTSRSGGSGRATRPSPSAREAGSVRARSFCLAHVSAGTWWWPRARWCAARCPTDAWSRGSRPGSSASIRPPPGGHGHPRYWANVPDHAGNRSRICHDGGSRRPRGGESDIEVAAQPGVSIRAAWPEPPRGHVEGSSDLVASAAYQPEPAAVAAARRFVRETLQSWLPAEQAPAGSGLVDDAVLLTSELVTNAVVHARTLVHVTCKLADGGLEVTVRDSLPASMVPGRAKDENIPAERTSGRGLLLPSALASVWGVTYGRAAKAVWFRISLASAREDGSGDSPASQPAARQSSTGQSRTGQSSTGQRGPERSMGSGYDELLARTVESARAALAADAAYVLMPDEDGDLRVRAVAGARSAELLAAPPSVLTAGFLVADQVTGVLAVAGALPAQFAKGAAGQLQQLADQVAAPLERSRLADIELRRKARAGVAAEASDLLAGPADQDAILALAGRAVVPRLAAWCAVLLAQPDGTLQVAYVQHAEESRCAALSWVAGRACPVAPWDPH